MVLPKTAVSLATSIWYYYATNVDYVADSSHSWTLQLKINTDIACRAVCNADPLCLQYLVEVVKGVGTGCYTAAVDFEETSVISHSIKAGFTIAQKTNAVTYASYSHDAVMDAFPSLDYIYGYYLCFSTPTGAKTEDSSSTCGHPLPKGVFSRASDGSICNSDMAYQAPNNIFSCNSKGAATSCLPGSGIDGIKCSTCSDSLYWGYYKTYSAGGAGACQSCGIGALCGKSNSAIINACDSDNGYGFNAAVDPTKASCSVCTQGAAKDFTSPCVRLPVCTDYSSICSTTTGFVLNCKPGYGFSGVPDTASANCLGCSKASLTWSAGGQKACTLCQEIPDGGLCDPTVGFVSQCPDTYPMSGDAGTSTAKCGSSPCPGGYRSDGKSACQQCDDPTSYCFSNGDFAGCLNPTFRTTYCGCWDPTQRIYCDN